MSNKNEEIEIPRIGLGKRLGFRLFVYFWMGLAKTFFILLTVLKWALVPVALLFDFLVLFPVGRMIIKIEAVPAFREGQESDLPDTAWEYLQQSRLEFEQLGFSLGRYLISESVLPNQHVYLMTMVNKDEGVGVGFMYIKLAKAKDDSGDIMACEFSCVKNGTFIDLTNNPALEPFLPVPGRHRFVLDMLTNESMFNLAREVQDKLDCRCNEKMLELLETNPRVLMNDEFRMMIDTNIKRGLMYKDEKNNVIQLTWKGALISTYQTLWPTSDLYRKRLKAMNDKFFGKLGIDINEIALEDALGLDSFTIDKPVDSLDSAVSVVAPVVAKWGVQDLPAIVEVHISFTDSKINVESVDLTYQKMTDYPQRNRFYFGEFSFHISNTDRLCEIREKDQEIHEREDRLGMDICEYISGDISGYLDFVAAVEKLYSAIGKGIGEDLDDVMIYLRMMNGRPVWCMTDFQPKQLIDVSIDAQTGEVVEKHREDEGRSTVSGVVSSTASADLGNVMQQLKPYEQVVWLPNTKRGDGALRVSKFGGKPWLARDEGYPLCEICKNPMQLFTQVNLEELEGRAPNLPAKGLLQFFHCVSNDECDSYEGWEAYPDKKMKLVRIVQSDEFEHNLPEPKFDYPVKPRYVTGWVKSHEYPMPAEEVFEQNISLTEAQEEACFEGKAGNTVLNYQKDKVGGWPWWVQYPEYPECPKCNQQMQYIMQLESEQNLDYMWGDAGVAYFYICPEHQDELATLWQCH